MQPVVIVVSRLLTAYAIWRAWRTRHQRSTAERMLAMMPPDLRGPLVQDFITVTALELDRIYKAAAAPPSPDFWGAIHGVTRAPGETDAAFRDRLLYKSDTPA